MRTPAFRPWPLLVLLPGLLGLLWWRTFPLAGNDPAALTAGTVKRPAGATGTVVVPDHFLRPWDPVTLFFPKDMGPARGGPEDHPERFVTLSPAHPGAYTWLDARTLQFRPAEPWPPLARFTWQVDRTSVSLASLMAAPSSSVPANGADGLGELEAITLTFPEPLDPAALAGMMRIELRPLPGVGGGPARWLGRDDFEVKAQERRGTSDPATYVIALAHPVPLGTRAIVHFRLALDDQAAESSTELTFATAEPFRAKALGCRGGTLPLTPDGVRYTRDQALQCGSGARTVMVEFSSPPRDLGPVPARNLVRFEPAVENLSFNAYGRTLEVSGDFQWETLYRVMLAPTPLQDETGRSLDIRGPSEVWVYFPRRAPYLQWKVSQGIVERFGPQRVPLEGRGLERVDLRMFPVDPLNRSFWAFPRDPVLVDESARPPGPGEEPEPFAEVDRSISPSELAARIAALGSPAVSSLVSLPLEHDGGAATFGLDLEPYLTRVSGRQQPGTWLVGIRRLDGSSQRAWMRVQVTDLAVSTAEEPRAVRFVVTSLSSGGPVAGATVRVEGGRQPTDGGALVWSTLFQGVTDAAGQVAWTAPGRDGQRLVRRIVVQKGDDTLVLDPEDTPDGYADNHWSGASETWLQWALEDLAGRGPQPEVLGHLFADRPVHRPEEEVHLKGYLRKREKGRLAPVAMKATLVVQGPGDLSWRYPVQLSAGAFYHKFAEQKLPTGAYAAWLEDSDGNRYGRADWRMEAYRLPRFEVQLQAPDQVPLDREFEVGLTATYYAGGRVGGSPVRWRVTQFPYTWTPKKREGFFYSSDGRFSRTTRFESSPRLEREDVTDDKGTSRIVLNPAIEPTAQPRSYVVEATVTGDDDQTVTTTRNVLALPPFVLGVKVPRYLEHAKAIAPEVLVAGPDGNLVPGIDVTVRLLNRQWHSVLRAGDFSSGVARYETDVVDEKVSETTVTSTGKPLTLSLPIARAGVYVVELEAHDKLGRAQVVAVDLYAGGEEPVAWTKPSAGVFTAIADKPAYDPGETAAIVVQSPFQTAQALVVIEGPDGNEYSWTSVKGGTTTVKVPIRGTYVPRLPVHVVLMRGRVPGQGPTPGSTLDLGRPSTVAATTWLAVNPVDNRVNVTLEHAAVARPGQTLPMTVLLKDPKGRPLPGEVTLWLVDQAVLALGHEQRLDPLPDFITQVFSRLTFRDTRNLVFGYLPEANVPGGDQGEDGSDLLDRTTLRKNFKSVPYYNPSIQVGADGVARVSVPLPDNLTNFKVRAKAASGPDRFGYASSQVSVRLPVIVQPALPRFVRPGDAFVAAAIGRIVEGKGGAGSAEVRVEGVKLTGPAKKTVTWEPQKPERLEFPVEVPSPPYTTAGRLAYDQVTFKMAVERASDKAADAFEVKLPVREDRPRVLRQVLTDLEPGKAVTLPEVPATARAGTVRRTVLVSDQPGLVRMAAGLDFLHRYPYGCTEQRTSLARAYLALRQFRDLLHLEASRDEIDRVVQQTLEYVGTVIDGNGLCGYWPGSRGYVSLTAWVLEFLVDAKQAGYAVDDGQFSTVVRALQQALRSDYSHFVSGEEYAERTWALAALARAGKFDAAYAAELARKAQYLDQEGTALVLNAFAGGGQAQTPVVQGLARSLWDGVVFRLYQGREVYGGLQDRGISHSGLILPGETRTLALTARALAKLQPQAARLPVLIDALVTLGQGNGWGSTNANAAALSALSEVLKPPFGGAARSIQVRLGNQQSTLTLGKDNPVGYLAGTAPGNADVLLAAGAGGPVVLRAETAYVPGEDGSRMDAAAAGFVVSRELLRPGAADAPAVRVPLEKPGLEVSTTVGSVLEEHVQVVNPQERHYVAVTVPLAAGVEPLNPNLATAPPEATPAGKLTLLPTYVGFMDDHVAYYYDTLPKGTYDFYFRTRATVPGRFIQPAATAELMYDGSVSGSSPGARVVVGSAASSPSKPRP